MATTAYVPHPSTVVRITERLWSEEVARADQTDVLLEAFDKAYEFGNNRVFYEKSRYEPSE